MQTLDRVRLTRRDMLKLSAGGAGMFALTASGLAVPRGVAGGGAGALFIEAFPTSPLIVKPFDEPLPIPQAMAPVPKPVVDGWDSPPGPDNQAFVKGAGPFAHQLWPGTAPVADFPLPIVYQIKLEVAGHDFTSSPVQPIDSNGRDTTPPGSRSPLGSVSSPRSIFGSYSGITPTMPLYTSSDVWPCTWSWNQRNDWISRSSPPAG